MNLSHKRSGTSVTGRRIHKSEKAGLFSIIIAGDLYPSSAFHEIIQTSQHESLRELRTILKNCDLSIVNLESPLTESANFISKSGPHLNASPGHAKSIRDIGFDVVTLANNHILDMGEKGVHDTIKACAEASLKTVGAGVDLENARKPMIVKLNGFRLGILSLAENEFSVATASSAGASPLDLAENHHQIRKLLEKVDFILVVLHGGNEYYPLPRPGLVKNCRFLVDSGAGAIVCHHTHVPGGMEIYRNAPIFYGIGNFFFQKIEKPLEWYQGYLVKLWIACDTQARFELIPYWQCKEEINIRLMNKNEKKQFIQKLNGFSRIIKNQRLLSKKWGEYCSRERILTFYGMLGLNKIECILLKMGFWPFWKMSRKRLNELLNLFRCDSHQEKCIEVLKTEIKNL